MDLVLSILAVISGCFFCFVAFMAAQLALKNSDFWTFIFAMAIGTLSFLVILNVFFQCIGVMK